MGYAQDELVEAMEADVRNVLKKARWGDWIDVSFTVLGVLASFVATILLSQKHTLVPERPVETSPWILASIAAVPAATTCILRILRIRERTNWSFHYAARISSLAIQLKFAEKPNVEEFAQQYAQVSDNLEAQWATITRFQATANPPNQGDF